MMENSANSKLFDKLYSKKLENVAIYNTHQFDYPKCSDDNKKQKVQLLMVATGQEIVREKKISSRSGKSQGISL